jgi:hypothetical protein
MMMPSTIAARMYCVNLFDIAYPHVHRRFMMSQMSERRNTLCVWRRWPDVPVVQWNGAI